MLRSPMTHASQIVNAAGDGIITFDLDRRITFANPAAAAMLCGGGAEDLVGQPIRTYLPFLAASTLAGGEQWCWREEGTSFPIEYRTDRMSNESGQTVGVVVTFRDITERQAAERARDELIGVVSHELRTPLTSIRAALGLLAAGKLAEQPETSQRILELALANTNRLIRLVNDTLDLERLNSGHDRVRDDLCDADALMAQAADAMHSLAEETGIVLEVVPIGAQLRGDPDRLLQVLVNLLSNAIKFSPVGCTIRLDGEQSANELVFRVRDEGRGIPADKLETIFDRFAQVHHLDSGEKGGTGLGLAICRSIVEQHRGQIWAESTPGAGTTLFVALPCEPVVSPTFLDARGRGEADAGSVAA